MRFGKVGPALKTTSYRKTGKLGRQRKPLGHLVAAVVRHHIAQPKVLVWMGASLQRHACERQLQARRTGRLWQPIALERFGTLTGGFRNL